MLSFWNDSVALVVGWKEDSKSLQPEDNSGLNTKGQITQTSAMARKNRDLHSAATSGRILLKQNFSNFFFFLSFILLTVDLLNRWIISQHIPLSNLYESLLFLNWSFIAIFFFFVRDKLRFLIANLFPGNLNLEVEGAQMGLSESFMREGVAQDSVSPQNTVETAGRTIASKNFSTEQSGLLGPLLSSTVLFIQSFADWRLPDEMKEILPLIPALQSNWLLMHVSIMILSYAALFLGSILSITYIGADWYLKDRLSHDSEIATRGAGFASAELTPLQSSSIFLNKNILKRNGPGLATPRPTAYTNLHETFTTKSLSEVALLQLDSLRYRILAFAFPLLTLGILSGAIWANEAWGSYWSWDPKETWAFITWLIFAFYLHTRLQYNWQGTKSAFVASFGFFIVWICYLGVNLLGQGLHSYGWLH